MTKIKICGITKPEEIGYLNRCHVDYAGFVFFESSRRNISLEAAARLLAGLKKEIRKVAVTVSPTMELVRKLDELGFDLLQVHGALSEDVARRCGMPIWRAVNISSLPEAFMQLEKERAFECDKIAGYVADGAKYGGGKTFRWEEISDENHVLLQQMKEKTFILAGGLCAENVAAGIRLFSPDVVDVSSGVEGVDGKEESKIEKFVSEVRKNG